MNLWWKKLPPEVRCFSCREQPLIDVAFSSSENKLCTELNVTVVRSRLRDVPERCRIPRCGITRICEVWMIEDVEHLGAELKSRTLFNWNDFEQGKVRVHKPRPKN